MSVTELKPSTEEIAALGLVAAVRAASEAVSEGDVIELVSVSVDMSGLKGDGLIAYETRIDRKTRTLIFAAGTARRGGVIVMTASAVYRRLIEGDKS